MFYILMAFLKREMCGTEITDQQDTGEWVTYFTTLDTAYYHCRLTAVVNGSKVAVYKHWYGESDLDEHLDLLAVAVQ